MRSPAPKSSGAVKLSATLRDQFELAVLFRRIATVVLDAPVSPSVDAMRWTGPGDPDAFAALCARIDAPALPTRVATLAARMCP